MTDTLGWLEDGKVFIDGSHYTNWKIVEHSDVWHLQYNSHELSFDIYRHDGQYWKLYKARWSNSEGEYEYGFGGQACRMALVKYRKKCCSPHSYKPMKVGDQEWVRTYEVAQDIHEILQQGDKDPKYELKTKSTEHEETF